jgi:tRNA threonylcarbamoyladenosine biosynthesis protein TsaE
MTHRSTSVQQTEQIAGDLARSLKAGACVALNGDLGSGKTQFTRGIVAALGGDARSVSSPTFVLLHIYPTQSLTVYHLDAYRVHGASDFEQIGFDELLEQGGIVIVEWALRVPDLLPAGLVRVDIESIDETTRDITIARS